MADTTYTIGIDTSSAENSLRSLQNSFQTLGSNISSSINGAAGSFNSMSNSISDATSRLTSFAAAIATAVAASAVVNIAKTFEDLRISLEILYGSAQRGNQVFADIKKFASESVFSVNDLTETVIKLKAAGLEPTIEQLKLFADVSSVSADSVGALKAITDLYARTTAGGLGLEDLNRLADRGIPVFTILQDKLGLTRLELTKLGESSEGARLILDALEVGLNEKFGGGSEKRLGTVSQSISNLKDQFNNLIDAVGQAGLDKAFAGFVQTLGKILTMLTPIIALIGSGLTAAFQFLADNARITGLIVSALLTALSGAAMAAAIRGVTLLGSVLGGIGVALARNPVTLALAAIAGALISTKLVTTDFKLELDKAVTGPGGEGLANGKLADGARNFRAEAEGLNTALAKIRAELENVGNAYALQNIQIVKRLNLESELVGASEKTKTVRQALAQEEQRYQQQINSLLEQYKIKSISKNQEDIKSLPLIQAELVRISKEYVNHINNVEALNKTLYDRNELEKQRVALQEFANTAETSGAQKVRDLQNEAVTTLLPAINKQYYDIAAAATQQARSGIEAENTRRRLIGVTAMSTAEEAKYYDVALKNIGPLIEAQRELNAAKERQQIKLFERKAEVDLEKQLLDIRQSQTALNLGTLEKTYQGIDRAARDAAESELQAYAQRQNISRLDIDPGIVKQYYDAATKGSQQLKQAQAGLYEQSRQFNTGWHQALTTYVEDATNGAKVAQNVFNKAFQGMEDLLVNFAKTGKFQWKTFVQNLSEELLRSNIRQLLASVFGGAQDGMGGLGKLLGGLSGALGLGKGAVGDSATNPIYAFLVNGNGGLTGAANAIGGSQSGNNSGGGILDTLGNVVSGIGSTLSNVVSGIGDAIGGLFGGGGGGGILSTIGSFFGFADGGMIPNNKPVIVGERGPEILAGASGMRVMSNQDAFGSGSVTYNISAVDAPSFQALIARDPSFIHAVAMQGAKGLPRRY